MTKETVTIPWEFIDLLNQAAYIKLYRPNKFSQHKDGRICFFNRVYALGLIHRLRLKDEESPQFRKFKEIFLNDEEFQEIKSSYQSIDGIEDKKLDDFREKMMEKSFSDYHLFPSSIAKNFIDDDQKIMKNENSYLLEEVEASRFPDGSHKRIVTTKIPYRVDGQVVGIMGFSRDMGEAFELFNTLVETYPGAVISTTPEGGIDYCNPAMLKLFGYASLAEIKNAKDLYENEKDRDQFIQTINQKEKVTNYSTKLVRKNGEVFDAAITAAARKFKGKMIGVHGTIVDISDQLKKQKEMEEALADLKKAAFAMSANITNELNKLVTNKSLEMLLKIAEKDIENFKNLSAREKEIFNLYVYTNAKPRDIAVLLEIENTSSVRTTESEIVNKLGLPRGSGREGLREFARRIGVNPLDS